MQKIHLLVCAALLCLPAAINAHAMETGRRVVIYDNLSTEVGSPSTMIRAGNPGDLWVTLGDLKRATQFVLKPQGVCRDELCFPIPKKRRSVFLSKQGSTTWFNLSEFARLLRQPVAINEEHAVWYFGPRADEQNGYIDSLIAPDFTLPDMNGKQYSLSGFRGKKVLLLTWASW
jgi:AhpC/TSA family